MKLSTSFIHDKIQAYKFGYHPISKPNLCVHVYFIDGLLLDTGQSRMKKEVVNVLSNLPVDQIFLTHHDEDHTGNVNNLQAQFDCPVYASSLCAELMKNPPKISPAQWVLWGPRPANTTIQVKHNYIQTPNYQFEIIPIPGHADDMVCLYERKEGWLFSADLWVNDYIRYFMDRESMKQQIESMKKVLQLDFDTLLCSHKPQLTNGKVQLQKKLQFMEEFYGQVATLYYRGKETKAILQEMGLKEDWPVRFLSKGKLSTLNMVKSVIRDEQNSAVKWPNWTKSPLPVETILNKEMIAQQY